MQTEIHTGGHRSTQADTDTNTHMQTEIHTGGHRSTQADTYTNTHMQTEIHTGGHRSTQADTDKHATKQKIYIYIHWITKCNKMISFLTKP